MNENETAPERTRRPIAAQQADIRLIQAYLRAIGELGDPRETRGIDVVNGRADARTIAACDAFMVREHASCTLSTRQEINAVIATLRSANERINHTAASDEGLAHRQALAQAFAQNPALQRHPQLRQLHPQMRVALAAALDDLAQQGISVTMREGYRPPQAQEEHVRMGRSTAAPYWSMHNYGLAVDLMPRSATTQQAFDARSPTWQAIIATMQRYGFYSLHAAQGWDLPHFEIPALTADVVSWPQGADGFKVIPDTALPSVWRSLNQRVLTNAVQQLIASRPGVER